MVMSGNFLPRISLSWRGFLLLDYDVADVSVSYYCRSEKFQTGPQVG